MMPRLWLLAAPGVALGVALGGCPGNRTGAACQLDSDCGGEVCARDGECLPASDVWSVKVTWTLRGMAASATTCAATPDFYLYFAGPDPRDTFGYAPVPCAAGVFTIDKLPRRYTSVELGVEGGFSDQAAIDRAGTATLDLYP